LCNKKTEINFTLFRLDCIFAAQKNTEDMSRICQITGKKVMVGNNVSHAKNRTKRKFYPNLQTKKFFVPETGETIILKVSANALRTIDKKGIAAVLAEAKENGNILV
jgi:large subunit ribosomal protein L28